jgi:MarR family transcriptional regulator, negative regulator of the multidrug operon emrRAB
MSARDANLVGALGLALADRLAEAAEPAGGGSATAALVTLFGRDAGSTIDALARVLGLSHSGTVRLADRLVAAGLLERRRGADQRSAALYLTPAGRRAARRVLARRAASLQSALGLLTDDQQHELGELAALILGRLGAGSEAERRLCRLCDLEACGRSRGACPVAPRRRR